MTLLLLMSTLSCAVTVYGACVVNEGQVPCPPPFPDFAVIFRETLSRVPELRLFIQNTSKSPGSSGGCSPLAVNWSEFNSRLNDDNAVPLDPFCSQQPTTTTTTTAPSSSSSSSSSSSRSPEVVPDAVQSQESRDRIIAIAVGVGGGVVLLAAAVILITFAAIRCRRQKGDGLQRTISTISQSPLVTDEIFQPTTPDTPFARDAFGAFDNSRSLRKGVIELSDCTFQDSSTDGTLPRTKDPTHATLDRGATTEKEIEPSPEEAKTTGCVNLAAVTEDEEEQDDAGYAGSEIGQELWENEMNALFEGAKMEEEENEDAAAADKSAARLPTENCGQEEKRRDLGSVRGDETAPQIRESKIPAKLKLNLNFPSSSSSEPSAYQSIEITPAKLPDSPFCTPSSTKPLISPRQHLSSRHPLSQQAPASDQNSTKASKARVRFEIDSSAASPPPAYSSPPPLTLAGTGELYNGDRHAEMPVDVPNELPSYTEAVSGLVGGNRESSGWRPVAARRLPQPKPQTKPKSASSVDSQKSPVTTSPPGKRTGDTAAAVVARPRVPPPAAKKIGTDDASARKDRVDSNSEGDNNTSAGHSSRPVRSLLNQFEAIASGRPD